MLNLKQLKSTYLQQNRLRLLTLEILRKGCGKKPDLDPTFEKKRPGSDL